MDEAESPLKYSDASTVEFESDRVCVGDRDADRKEGTEECPEHNYQHDAPPAAHSARECSLQLRIKQLERTHRKKMMEFQKLTAERGTSRVTTLHKFVSAQLIGKLKAEKAAAVEECRACVASDRADLLDKDLRRSEKENSIMSSLCRELQARNKEVVAQMKNSHNDQESKREAVFARIQESVAEVQAKLGEQQAASTAQAHENGNLRNQLQQASQELAAMHISAGEREKALLLQCMEHAKACAMAKEESAAALQQNIELKKSLDDSHKALMEIGSTIATSKEEYAKLLSTTNAAVAQNDQMQKKWEAQSAELSEAKSALEASRVHACKLATANQRLQSLCRVLRYSGSNDGNDGAAAAAGSVPSVSTEIENCQGNTLDGIMEPKTNADKNRGARSEPDSSSASVFAVSVPPSTHSRACGNEVKRLAASESSMSASSARSGSSGSDFDGLDSLPQDAYVVVSKPLEEKVCPASDANDVEVETLSCVGWA